jgi:hypothetical protein
LMLIFFISTEEGCMLYYTKSKSVDQSYFSVNDRPKKPIRIAGQRDSSPNRTVHSTRLIEMLPTIVG